jgi:hypothetical protein
MAQRINAKLYIEGCEIPFTTVSITSAVNQASTCVIDVIPSEYVKNIVARSNMLVLFQEGQVWKVLWDGEFRGWGMSKSSGSLQMQILGADHSNALSYMTRAIFENFGDALSAPVKAIFHTGQEINLQPLGSGTFANLITAIVSKASPADFGSILTQLIQTCWNNVPYFQDANTRNKVVPRFISLPDSNLKAILTNNIANDFIRNVIANKFTGNTSLEAVLAYFMDIAAYIRVPVVGPTNYGGIPTLSIFKPKNHFSTPPVFNTFFPGMYSSMSGYGVDHFTEPTRMLMTTENVPVAGGYRSMFFFNDSRSGLALNTTVGNAAIIKDFLSPEEIDGGILPLELNLNYERANQAIAAATDPSLLALQSTYQAYAYYQFVEAKFALRRCSLNGIFHPYCIVGYPGAIFDPHQSLFGMVDSVTHTLSAEGSASSIINFTHVYPADRNDPSGLTYPPLPTWMSQNYRPEGSDATYAAMFGANIIDDKTKHAALGGPNIASAKRSSVSYKLANNQQYSIADIASTVYPIATNSGTAQATPLYTQNVANPRAFEYKYTYRNIITAKDYFNYLNIKVTLADETTEPPKNLGKSSLIFNVPTGYSLNAQSSYTISGTDTHKYDAALALQNDINSAVGRDGR